MGNYGNAGGVGSNGQFSVIDNGKVRVPSKVWKVVVVIPKGNSDINRIDRNATVLCVSMPNDNRLYTTGNQTAWRNYIISVSALEIESTSNGTALSLFSNIPEAERTFSSQRFTNRDYLISSKSPVCLFLRTLLP